MVFVKVRETYDLHTVKSKMTVIGIHTPKPDIIKANFPGLLMQCKAYKPVSCDVRIACASTLPLDPLGVGTNEGDVAPEDLFNPILYKACSNFGMSQIEARICANSTGAILSTSGNDISGNTADVEVDSVTSSSDEFATYYGFLSNAHEWRHANPQQGLEMTDLRPLVYELLYNVGDNGPSNGTVSVLSPGFPQSDGTKGTVANTAIKGNGKPIPWINCTSYSDRGSYAGFTNTQNPAIGANLPPNFELDVPWINCVVGAIIIPPSRLHELFYRMVVEWTIEFSSVRPLSEITNWTGLGSFASLTHYQNYDYSETKKALVGTDDTILTSDQCMVSANVDVNKVM